MKKIIVMFSGGASSLKYLFEHDENYGKNYKIVCGISNKRNTKGEKFCKENGIEFMELNTKQFCLSSGFNGKLKDMPFELRNDYYKELLALIKPLNPDIILLSGFMLTITEPLLSFCPIINVHPADLRILDENNKPKYTGDDAVRLALEDGQKFTASTIHYVEEEVDCGKIICVSDQLAVDNGISPEDHQEKMKTLCDGPAYKEALRILCQN